jgi:hypothetical protein
MGEERKTESLSSKVKIGPTRHRYIRGKASSTCASANAAKPQACAAAERRGSGDDALSNKALDAASPSGK